ncbi:type VI secretion protein [Streptomyces sp. NBC_01443]|uniref:type VI secretion protein n=1 Tax=Streptomyces sp. NBC_01443 TaxID=2903868 RepID=UPI00225295CA|nr:type VI secretion protein [Streptomyces sp. NBC_01443]MCX4629061.1 type IV secretory system conjugative DNA transfer family protein [Streptomyces sp. NBC_01443]
MHDERNGKPGGIPDALLLTLLAFLLGLAVLVWTSTGLAALFSKGAWPSTVTFTRTPGAVRALIAQPHDIPGAWPDTAPSALSGWGLFWGLFISQILILLVLTIFVMGVIARTKSRRHKPTHPAEPTDPATPHHPPTPHQSAAPSNSAPAANPAPPAFEARGSGGRAPGSSAPTIPTPTGPHHPATLPIPAPAANPAPPAFEARGLGGGAPGNGGGNSGNGGNATGMAYGQPAQRHPLALQALAAAEGAALVITSSPALWAETKDARAKLGPVLLYDPSHLCDTPVRMHWNPADACADRDTAAARATALLAPVRPQARMDAAVADTAETLLRSWLQAAALDDRPFKQLHRWAQGNSAQDPVRILRTHPQAAPGAAGELESALTAHPERREQAQHLTARALSCLTSIHIREACNPNRTDALTLASFVSEGGTLYMVGEPLEDPRTHPGAMPLLTALAASVVEHGRRMAARSSHGRLDPPLTLVLEDVAAVAPIPQLPELLQEAPLPLLALCRSREQARARWPEAAFEPTHS